MKKQPKYHAVAKEYAKTHSVGDNPWSAPSFVEGFNQAIQFLDPDHNLVICPKCNTSHVACHEISYPASNLPMLQYPLSVDSVFVCQQCEHKFNKRLKLSAE